MSDFDPSRFFDLSDFDLTRAWLAEYEEATGNGAAPPGSEPFDPDNPPPGCTVYTPDEVESWRRNRAGPKGPPLPPKERPTITVTPGNLPGAVVSQGWWKRV